MAGDPTNRKRGDEPFAPSIPGDIRGQTSGDSGNIIGFNETKVFIRPHTLEDTFNNPNECFTAAGAEGCFLPEQIECDQVLEEGEFACAMGTISRTGCSITELTNLTRQIRVVTALNQPPGEAPIVTEAGITTAPEVTVTPDAPEADLPSGEEPAGPTAEAPPLEAPPDIGGGGEAPPQVKVPLLIGLTLSDGEEKLISVGLVLGTVTTQVAQNRSIIDSVIKSARADDPEICAQDPVVGTEVDEGSAVDVETCADTNIPEPSTFALFALGVSLLIIMTWWRRRRLG